MLILQQIMRNQLQKIMLIQLLKVQSSLLRLMLLNMPQEPQIMQKAMLMTIPILQPVMHRLQPKQLQPLRLKLISRQQASQETIQ